MRQDGHGVRCSACIKIKRGWGDRVRTLVDEERLKAEMLITHKRYVVGACTIARWKANDED